MTQDNNGEQILGVWGIFALLLITMRLTEMIHWSWFWVLSPLWVPVAAAFSIFLGALIFTLVVRK